MLETHGMLRSDTTALFERLREANILLQEVLSGAHDNMSSIEHTMVTRVSEFVAATLAAHWSSPFCAGYFEFGTVPQAATSLVMIGGWVALLLWIWRGNGATLIARVGPALSARPADSYSPRLVRLTITAMVLVSAVGSAFTWRTIPDAPGLACSVSTAAR